MWFRSPAQHGRDAIGVARRVGFMHHYWPGRPLKFAPSSNQLCPAARRRVPELRDLGRRHTVVDRLRRRRRDRDPLPSQVADARLEVSLALFRAHDDPAGIAVCLAHLAAAEAFAGRDERATALADEAVNVAEAAQDEDALAFALVASAMTARRYEQATRRAPIAITHLRKIGDLRQLGYVRTSPRIRRSPRPDIRTPWPRLDQGLDALLPLEDASLVYLIQPGTCPPVPRPDRRGRTAVL
jgi:hypothetical protein